MGERLMEGTLNATNEACSRWQKTERRLTEAMEAESVRLAAGCTEKSSRRETTIDPELVSILVSSH
jgi:hypothetical protein